MANLDGDLSRMSIGEFDESGTSTLPFKISCPAAGVESICVLSRFIIHRKPIMSLNFVALFLSILDSVSSFEGRSQSPIFFGNVLLFFFLYKFGNISITFSIVPACSHFCFCLLWSLR